MLEYPVLTPENVRFRYTLAGPGSRLIAWMIDLGVILVLLAVIGVAMGLASEWFGNYALAVYGLLSFLLVMGYWIILEYRWEGRTPGKRLVGLRVVGEHGLPLDFTQVLLRNLLRSVDLLPAGAGFAALCSLLQRHHRRLGDLVAGTLVIRERRPPRPAAVLGDARADELASARNELGLPPDFGRRLSRWEREFLLDLCIRRDGLHDGVRMRLFSQVAECYRQRLGVRQPQGISDEKLVLGICSGLLRDHAVTGTATGGS